MNKIKRLRGENTLLYYLEAYKQHVIDLFGPTFSKDVIFFWIPKTGGSSINKILKKYGCCKNRYEESPIPFKNKGISTFGHQDIFNLLKKNVIRKKYYESSFKFCIVRNPWDRLVSLYHYLEYDELMPFDEFCKEIRNIPPVGPYNVKGLSQANPQVDWIIDKEGEITVNYIGKFENLDQDIKKIFEIIGINEELGHFNKTNHKNYREYYNETTKNIVAEVYKKDIEVFNYEF